MKKKKLEVNNKCNYLFNTKCGVMRFDTKFFNFCKSL